MTCAEIKAGCCGGKRSSKIPKWTVRVSSVSGGRLSASAIAEKLTRQASGKGAACRRWYPHAAAVHQWLQSHYWEMLTADRNTPRMRRDKARVSIGLPVYNGEKFLEEALKSLLAQTYRDFELIISDNASTDGTKGICRAFAADDCRVHYHRSEHNRGLAWNFNRVFELSRGQYFKWAAHDDVCAPEFVERCIDVLERSASVVLCYTNAIIMDEHGRHLRDYADACNISSASPYQRFRHLLLNYRLSNPLFGVIRANALKMTRGFGNYVGSDVILLGELALRGEFYQVPECLFLRRDHPQKAGRAHPTVHELAIWHDPANRGRIQLRTWGSVFEHLTSIRRARMSAYEKTRCYLYMAKSLRWGARDMRNELLVAAKQLAGRLRG